ncbi:MAG: hypothetical protein ABI867_01795 [Kofleriaceae bacterium]
MNRALAVLLLVAASCASERKTELATLGNLSFDVPSGWNSRPLSDQRLTIMEWTPDTSVNDSKESLVIIRTQSRPAITKAGPSQLVRLLGEAQTGLAKSAFTKPTRLRNPHGFVGARIEGSFVPQGQTAPYQRLHGVFVDGESLLHVIYTARTLDREAFETLVDSLHRKGA